MKIALVHTGKAYLPEVGIYEKYFKSLGYDIEVTSISDELSHYDVLWYFMGKSGKRYNKNQYVIHEYASLSTGRFPILKDFIKKLILPKPDLRIFLNEDLKSRLNFKDNVPFEFRDMGVDDKFFDYNKDNNKNYDIVYVGAIANRSIDVALDLLISYKKNIKILVVGDVSESFKKNYKQVDFIGRVDYSLVPNYILQAKCCLNWIPDIYPYNIQTSTKFIEYFAMGMPIISNKYKWVDEYSKKMNIQYVDIFDKERVINLIDASNSTIYTSKPESWLDILNKLQLEKYFQK